MRAYPEFARLQLDRLRAQPEWMFVGFTGLLGLVMFRLGIDLSRDWPVALGAALVGGRRFIIGGYLDSPYVIPVALLLVLLAIGAVRLRLESRDS